MSKARRKLRKGKVELTEDASSREKNELLCCVPENIGSIECVQKVISDSESAVKMTCSNLQCTNSGLLHLKCYERLEKHLLSALGSTPKGKKWTEAQLEANLWNCRGADILHKFSKCSCGGTLAKAEMESEAPLPVPVVKKKENGKGNQKPKLNCGEGGKISDQKMFKWGSEEPVKEQTSIKQPKSTRAPEAKTAPNKTAPTKAASAAISKTHQLPLLKSDLPLLKKDLAVNKYSKAFPWTGKGPYQGQKTLEDISKILHVFNMPKNCSENHLGELFQAYGKVTDVWISAPPRNFAFITFSSAKGVDKVLADIPIRYGCHTLTVERKKARASKVSVSSSTCSKDECFCPANQLCTCTSSIPVLAPAERASPRRNPWSSSVEDKCFCPANQLCTCPTSVPTPPPVPVKCSNSQRHPWSPAADLVSATPPIKAAPVSVTGAQKKRQDSWKAAICPPDIFQTNESSIEMIQDLLGQSFSRELENQVDVEMFFSDDEWEEEVDVGASGFNENCEETEKRLQGELEDLLQEKNTLELENRQMRVENRKQDGELFQAKACNAALQQKLEALEEEHQREKELLEKAKVCNKVLRERMESVQTQLEQKVAKEKKLEEALCEGKDIQARMELEKEQLEAVVRRLLEALAKKSSVEVSDDGVNSKRMLRGTQSASGGLTGQASFAKVEESSSKPRPSVSKDPGSISKDPGPISNDPGQKENVVGGSTCTFCSLFNGPGTRTCLGCGTKLN